MTSSEGRPMQIGQVAAQTELSIRTVRHYDEVGLVTPSARSVGGFRLYTDHDIGRLLVIRRMKPLGFTLAEMKELLDSIDTLDDATATSTQRRTAAKQLATYRDKARESVAELRRQLGYANEFADLLAARTTPGSPARQRKAPL